MVLPIELKEGASKQQQQPVSGQISKVTRRTYLTTVEALEANIKKQMTHYEGLVTLFTLKATTPGMVLPIELKEGASKVGKLIFAEEMN